MITTGGTCTLEFQLQRGENTKLDMSLDCLSCHFPNIPLDLMGMCDLYSDIDFENGKKQKPSTYFVTYDNCLECSSVNEECHKTLPPKCEYNMPQLPSLFVHITCTHSL